MNKLQITAELNNPIGIRLVESINALIDTIETGVQATVTMFTKTITLPVTVVDTYELGSTFTPPIDKQPSLYNAMKIEGDGTGTDYSFVIGGFRPNVDGIHWDIMFPANDTEITNLIINVQ